MRDGIWQPAQNCNVRISVNWVVVARRHRVCVVFFGRERGTLLDSGRGGNVSSILEERYVVEGVPMSIEVRMDWVSLNLEGLR